MHEITIIEVYTGMLALSREQGRQGDRAGVAAGFRRLSLTSCCAPAAPYSCPQLMTLPHAAAWQDGNSVSETLELACIPLPAMRMGRRGRVVDIPADAIM